MADESAILDGVASIVLGGCGSAGCPWANGDSPFTNNVYSLGGGTQVGVKDLPDDIANGGFPAFLVMDGGLPEIVAGSYEVATWEVEASIWSEYTFRGERLRELLDLRADVWAAFRAHARGRLVDPEVSSVLPTSVGRMERRQWRAVEPAPSYLVIPFTVEVTFRRAVTYRPA